MLGVGKKGACSARQHQVARACGPARGALDYVQKPLSTVTPKHPFGLKEVHPPALSATFLLP